MKSLLAAIFAAAIALVSVGCDSNDSTDSSTDSSVTTSGGDIPTDVVVTGSNNQVQIDMDVYMLQPGSTDNSQKAGNDLN
jgi:hypothetical protein